MAHEIDGWLQVANIHNHPVHSHSHLSVQVEVAHEIDGWLQVANIHNHPVHSHSHLSVQVEVAHEIDGWLQVANIHGEVGLVPSSFVRILHPGEVAPAAIGAAGAALSSAVSTGVEGLPGTHHTPHAFAKLQLHCHGVGECDHILCWEVCWEGWCDPVSTNVVGLPCKHHMLSVHKRTGKA